MVKKALETFSNMFRSLHSRNYRLFFIGQSLSLSGTWMQQVAMSWLIYRMTNSAFMLGAVNFVTLIPAFLLAPLAGITADRYPKRQVLFFTQGLAMAQALVLTILVLSKTVAVWHILFLSFILGIANAYDAPTRHSFTVEMIEHKDDLGNAIALNSTMFNLARLAGPSLAGVVIVAWGEGACFLLNTLSYLAIMVALMLMKMPPQRNPLPHRDIWEGIREGFQYAFGFSPVRDILFLLSFLSLMGVSYQMLMPVFAKDIFHGGASTYGFLMGTMGAGALAGALFLAARTSVRGLSRVIATTATIFGLCVMAFSFSRTLIVSLGLLLVSGFSMMVVMASCNTVLQSISDDDKRGRIMSFYTMTLMGLSPFGSLLAGAMASWIGAPETVFFGGLFCCLGALSFVRQIPSFRAHVRPIYIQKGIIPTVDFPEALPAEVKTSGSP